MERAFFSAKQKKEGKKNPLSVSLSSRPSHHFSPIVKNQKIRALAPRPPTAAASATPAASSPRSSRRPPQAAAAGAALAFEPGSAPALQRLRLLRLHPLLRRRRGRRCPSWSCSPAVSTPQRRMRSGRLPGRRRGQREEEEEEEGGEAAPPPPATEPSAASAASAAPWASRLRLFRLCLQQQQRRAWQKAGPSRNGTRGSRSPKKCGGEHRGRRAAKSKEREQCCFCRWCLRQRENPPSPSERPGRRQTAASGQVPGPSSCG